MATNYLKDARRLLGWDVAKTCAIANVTPEELAYIEEFEALSWPSSEQDDTCGRLIMAYFGAGSGVRAPIASQINTDAPVDGSSPVGHAEAENALPAPERDLSDPSDAMIEAGKKALWDTRFDQFTDMEELAAIVWRAMWAARNDPPKAPDVAPAPVEPDTSDPTAIYGGPGFIGVRPALKSAWPDPVSVEVRFHDAEGKPMARLDESDGA